MTLRTSDGEIILSGLAICATACGRYSNRIAAARRTSKSMVMFLCSPLLHVNSQINIEKLTDFCMSNSRSVQLNSHDVCRLPCGCKNAAPERTLRIDLLSLRDGQMNRNMGEAMVPEPDNHVCVPCHACMYRTLPEKQTEPGIARICRHTPDSVRTGFCDSRYVWYARAFDSRDINGVSRRIRKRSQQHTVAEQRRAAQRRCSSSQTR